MLKALAVAAALGVVTLAVVVVAAQQSTSQAETQELSPTATPTAAPISTPEPTPIVSAPVPVSVLGDSHASEIHSWWRLAVWDATTPGIARGAFASQPGASALALTERIDEATAHGGFVIVQAGTNNLLGDQAPSATVTELEDLWAAIRARGAQPIAALVPPSTPRPEAVIELNELIRQSAAFRAIPVLDLYSVVTAGDGSWAPTLTADGTHANQAGALLMGQAASEQLPGLVLNQG
ncbi:SGNH/GDSL hydrolase family protein [Cryobacterium frigoriphilum]|uniref:SGNH/GDSL hydrolase family protein n=1 Tax=Cryobacterium frigoriphilum TaxID=1259150 RepID=A0A4R8ZU11_9MICO|nr:SGNH/GDSL hydrolase family protein [Cryobacterium frigoriphilum]TFD45396.1 SGNH/GDSL hydrolase family protein [Cryobacterium frigoriphilum]